MPRLRDRAVLDAGLTGPQLLWEQEGFALADGYDEATAKYRGLVLPTDGVSGCRHRRDADRAARAGDGAA